MITSEFFSIRLTTQIYQLNTKIKLGQQMQQLQQMQMIQNIRFGLGGFSNPLGASYFPDQANHGHGDHLKHGEDFNKPQKAMVRSNFR